MVSTHSRPKAAATQSALPYPGFPVSTHSRPKAAARRPGCRRQSRRSCFNTQPPEGGCSSLAGSTIRGVWFQHTAARRRLPKRSPCAPKSTSFNTQPPEGGCVRLLHDSGLVVVSTHSRPKAAATDARRCLALSGVSTHSRPKAAAYLLRQPRRVLQVSTHSRPKAAAVVISDLALAVRVSTHSRPKAAAGGLSKSLITNLFQHTAARRRLLPSVPRFHLHFERFNTQPPEGGCAGRQTGRQTGRGFNTQPPEGGCP